MSAAQIPMRRRHQLPILLCQTLLITAGGFLLIKLVATGSTMSDAELLIGPVSIGLVWLGMGGARRHPPAAAD